uniref:Uncharacterized protein n=1 Tax=Arundo donax TaxID=35708 RepID=A0A0A9AUM7_ARUDO
MVRILFWQRGQGLPGQGLESMLIITKAGDQRFLILGLVRQCRQCGVVCLLQLLLAHHRGDLIHG